MSLEQGVGQLSLEAPLVVSTTNYGASDKYIPSQDETISLRSQPFTVQGKHGAYTFDAKGLVTGYEEGHYAITLPDPLQEIVDDGGPTVVTDGTLTGDGSSENPLSVVTSSVAPVITYRDLGEPQTIPNNTNTDVTWDTSHIGNMTHTNVGNRLNLATGVWTCATSGMYFIGAGGNYSTPRAGAYKLSFIKNASDPPICEGGCFSQGGHDVVNLDLPDPIGFTEGDLDSLGGTYPICCGKYERFTASDTLKLQARNDTVDSGDEDLRLAWINIIFIGP